jgi:hypothetical protein
LAAPGAPPPGGPSWPALGSAMKSATAALIVIVANIRNVFFMRYLLKIHE